MRLFFICNFAFAAGLLAGCGNHQSRASDNTPHLHVDTRHTGEHPWHWVTIIRSNGSWMLRPASSMPMFLDDEMENYVRIAPPSFDVAVKLPSQEELLHFVAIANHATR